MAQIYIRAGLGILYGTGRVLGGICSLEFSEFLRIVEFENSL